MYIELQAIIMAHRGGEKKNVAIVAEKRCFGRCRHHAAAGASSYGDAHRAMARRASSHAGDGDQLCSKYAEETGGGSGAKSTTVARSGQCVPLRECDAFWRRHVLYAACDQKSILEEAWHGPFYISVSDDVSSVLMEVWRENSEKAKRGRASLRAARSCRRGNAASTSGASINEDNHLLKAIAISSSALKLTG